MIAADKPSYRWVVAATAFTIYFFTNGMAIFVPQNLFPRLMEEFSVTAGEVSRVTFVTLLFSAFLAPLAGFLIDRFGVVRIIRFGLLVMLACFALYPFVQSIQQLYVIHAFLSLGLVCSGLMSNVVLLTAWFSKGRGSVVGLLASGSSLAGAALPLMIAPLVLDPEFGWRWGFGSLSIGFLVFAFLPGFLLMRAPQNAAPTGEAPTPTDGVELSEAVRHVTLWALAVGSACLWFCIQAMNSQISIFFEQEAALTPGKATLLFSVIFWFSFFGKFLFGAVSDLLPKRRVMQIASSLLFAGCLLLFDFSGSDLTLTRKVGQLTAFAVVFGLGFGGSFTMIQLVAVESFGQRALGKILGIIVFIDSIGAALGTALTGQLRTSTGDYTIPFIMVSAVALVAVVAVSMIKPLQKQSS